MTNSPFFAATLLCLIVTVASRSLRPLRVTVTVVCRSAPVSFLATSSTSVLPSVSASFTPTHELASSGIETSKSASGTFTSTLPPFRRIEDDTVTGSTGSSVFSSEQDTAPAETRAAAASM